MACKSDLDSGGRSTAALDHVPILGTSVLVLEGRFKIKTGSHSTLRAWVNSRD
jgi:hypothetical protein